MAMAVSCQNACRPSSCPPWLQAALADIEQRFNSLDIQTLPAFETTTSDSFADRAENYYQKRPQLLALLHDLRLHFLHLADRYSHSLLKLSPSTTTSELSDDNDDPPLSSISTLSDDAESCHNPDVVSPSLDSLLVDLTMSLVATNMLEEELRDSDRLQFDSLRKIELQKSLLELMESERAVLVAENERLGFVAAVKEEEAGYMRRRAGEMAEAVVRMREEHRVCMLGRRVEMLEKREREWGEVVRRREREKLEVRIELESLREENRRLRKRWKRRRWWWGCCGGAKGGGFGGCLWDPFLAL